MHNIINSVTALYCTTLPYQLAQVSSGGLGQQVKNYGAPNATQWDRYVGPHGALALSLLIGAIFLSFFVINFHREAKRTDRLEAAAERRHQEAIKSTQVSTDKLISLTVDVAGVAIRSTAATEAVNKTLGVVEQRLASRYCLMHCHPLLRKVVSELVMAHPDPTPDTKEP